jgi:ribosomal-protein-alanine N-acetyltransferase
MVNEAERSDGVLRLRRPRASDAPSFVKAVARSRASLHPWISAPDTEERFLAMLERASATYVPSVLVLEQNGAIVGAMNLSEVSRGNFLNAHLGYYAFQPHAGRGYMARGMRLVLDFAFGDLALHRVEANVQPGNGRSSKLLRAAGFEHEGFSKGFLYIDGAWRDHERWAMRVETYLSSRSG